MELTCQEIQAALEALQPGQMWIQPLFRDGECQAGIDVGCDHTGCLVHYEVYGVAQFQQLHKTTASAALMVYEEARRWDLDEPCWILETDFK